MSSSTRRLAVASGILFFVAACGGPTPNSAPPAVKRELLTGKWQAREKEQLFQTIEFKDDKKFQATLFKTQSPIAGTYAWSGDTKLTLEFQFTDEGKKAGKEALAAYRQYVKDRAKAGGGQYEQQITASASQYVDDLIDKQDWIVNITEGQNADLVLKSNQGVEFVFKRE
jgi:hypothetical protein